MRLIITYLIGRQSLSEIEGEFIFREKRVNLI